MRDFRTQLAIDKTASAERIELMKRAAMSPEAALKESIASGLADEAITDKAAWIAEQTKAYNDHVAKGVVAFKKGSTEMTLHDETIRAIAKNVCERNAPPVFAKTAFIEAIARRADEIKKAGESAQQSFARAITQDDVGRLLYKASKSALGPEVAPGGESDYPNRITKPPPWAGPAHARMQALADDHLAANPRKTAAGAYASVYTDTKNAELRSQVISEHHNAIMSAQQLDGARTGLVS